MNSLQFKIITTWLIGPATLFIVFGMSDLLPIHWSFVLIVGFGVCSYLRRALKKDANNVFKIMQIKSKAFVIIYFLALSASCVWLYLEFPNIFEQYTLSKLVIIMLVLLPFIPALLRHEHNLYKVSGTKNA